MLTNEPQKAFICLYRQYGNWYITSPFATLREAQRHADMYLRTGKPQDAHKQMCTIREIELPTQEEHEASL